MLGVAKSDRNEDVSGNGKSCLRIDRRDEGRNRGISNKRFIIVFTV